MNRYFTAIFCIVYIGALLRNKVNKIFFLNIPKRHKIAVLESLQNHAALLGLFTSVASWEEYDACSNATSLADSLLCSVIACRLQQDQEAEDFKLATQFLYLLGNSSNLKSSKSK